MTSIGWHRIHLALVGVLAGYLFVSGSVVGSFTSHSGGEHFLEDSRGDVGGSASVPWPDAFVPAVDLLWLDYAVTADVISFTLGVESLAAAHTPSKDSTRYRIAFHHEGVDYRLDLLRQLPVPVFTQDPILMADFLRWDGGTWINVHEPTLVTDEESASLFVQIPLDFVVDSQGLRPHPGSVLRELLVNSWQYEEDPNHEPGEGQFWTDRMPNVGRALTPLDFEVPVEGSIRLSSNDGRRLSNGGPDVVLFPFAISNVGESEQVVDMAVDEIPPGWDVTILDESIHVAAGGNFDSLVAVQIPSAHAHGTQESLTLRAMGQTSDFEHEIPLIVEYTVVPQPEGHHNTLHIHTAEREPLWYEQVPAVTGTHPSYAFMNTLTSDERATGPPVSPTGIGNGSGGWRIPLDPVLGMGLKFMANESMHVTLDIDSSHPTYAEEVELTIWLVAGNGSSDQVLSSMETVRAFVDGPTKFDARPTVRPDADVVPYRLGQNLELVVRYVDASPEMGLTMPLLLPGGAVELPLLEFRDEIPLPASLAMDASVSPSLHRSPAGGIAKFSVVATNHLADPTTFQLTPILNGDGVTIDSHAVRVAAGGSATFAVAVDVPDALRDGDVHQALLRLDSDEHRMLIEASVLIDGNAPLTTDLEQTRKTPGLQLGLALMVTATLALQRARRVQ